jgi:hypothetical protein
MPLGTEARLFLKIRAYFYLKSIREGAEERMGQLGKKPQSHVMWTSL